jgi:tripartite-type tricarboxylate transporter receptor subunit TctC
MPDQWDQGMLGHRDGRLEAAGRCRVPAVLGAATMAVSPAALRPTDERSHADPSVGPDRFRSGRACGRLARHRGPPYAFAADANRVEETPAMRVPRRRILAGLLAAAGLSLVAPALAQNFPTRPVSIIVPFAAGGPTDTVTRLVAEVMARDLGQPVVVENVGGAGGTLGAARVAQARPDGHSLLLHHIGMSTIPTLYRRLPYDPINGFTPLGLVTEVPMTIVAKRAFPANTLAEVVARVRQEREGINLANAGIGAASHLCGLLFQSALNVPLTTVPYRGTGPAMNDLVAGNVDLLCDQTTNTTEQIRAGTIRAYAVTTRERVASLPELPTAADAGLPGFEVSIWHALYGPRNLPAPIVARLNQALRVALRDERLGQRFADLGTAPIPDNRADPETHRAFWQADIAKWRPIIQAAGQFAD